MNLDNNPIKKAMTESTLVDTACVEIKIYHKSYDGKPIQTYSLTKIVELKPIQTDRFGLIFSGKYFENIASYIKNRINELSENRNKYRRR